MDFEKSIPNVYYVDVANGLKMFVDCSGFTIGYNEIKSSETFRVLNKDGLGIFLYIIFLF